MQRSELETEIGHLLGDPNHDRWSTSVLRTRIEEAQTFIEAITNAVKTVETLTPVASTATVTIDTSTMDIVRVTIKDSNGDWKPLEGRSRDDLDFYTPNWENLDPGEPLSWFFDATNSQINLVPAPDATWAQTNGLKVWEIQIPTTLTGDSSQPFEANAAMQAYANSIVHWVVAQCWMDDGTPEALAKAKFHKSGDIDRPGEFEKYVRLINAKFDSPSKIPSRIKWYPQGGRIGGMKPSKSAPFG